MININYIHLLERSRWDNFPITLLITLHVLQLLNIPHLHLDRIVTNRLLTNQAPLCFCNVPGDSLETIFGAEH